MNKDLILKKIGDWNQGFSYPLYIAGPCSVETPEQLDQTVDHLVQQGIRTIRAGVWKPRTRPNSFEGVGAIALPWIQEVKEKHGVKFAIEVASPAHVEEALKAGIDVIWIGARSTVNPFTVQDIADSLKGVDIPVLIKNPINPDLALWIGAIERIAQAGITNIGAIHRGFSNFNDTKYRNSPTWQIPIELKSLFPDLPLLCDPSHICGNRDLIPHIAQKALDLSFDGLIIESHVNPDKAWSDGAQQLTPSDLGGLLHQLKTRKVALDDPELQSQLDIIREQIDDVDREILELLSQRMSLVEKVGQYKKLNNVAILQMERWNKVFQTRPEWAKALNLKESFAKDLFKLIHTESIKKQTEVMEGK
ncbi:bifunctional 3-deoxy-7-phosphoheptulonate synthase/chorismate mutase type II [Litoribacter populi]|uniref:bifunctional 3-deoxy-7-phosphoheptulonate synthase/chorismate mutase type II n=1 Tax=Litoribacter populi TaxID=2598460 RepID=UPI00117C735C|nr:bifunctional 3-deoxy-7-phosphoheptulonate synthase/chorismate mutase type II [Litoribacter populi]